MMSKIFRKRDKWAFDIGSLCGHIQARFEQGYSSFAYTMPSNVPKYALAYLEEILPELCEEYQHVYTIAADGADRIEVRVHRCHDFVNSPNWGEIVKTPTERPKLRLIKGGKE